MKYEFKVEGQITGKARPRLNTYTGSVYTPTKTKEYEYFIKQCFKLAYPKHQILTGRVSVSIVAKFEVPKSASKSLKEKMLSGSVSPTKKPDIDNVVKIALDAMNKFVFKDDNQITKLNVEKVYADKEEMIISVEEY